MRGSYNVILSANRALPIHYLTRCRLVVVADLGKQLGLLDSCSKADQLSLEYTDFLVAPCDVTKSEDVLSFWSDAESTYPLLVELVRLMMTFPHSNAASERMFSMLKKIHTDFRDNLCLDTIRALLAYKVNSYGCCINQKYDDERLKQLKRAAMTYNDRHTSASASSDKIIEIQD